jgi:hypothetical protein
MAMFPVMVKLGADREHVCQNSPLAHLVADSSNKTSFKKTHVGFWERTSK